MNIEDEFASLLVPNDPPQPFPYDGQTDVSYQLPILSEADFINALNSSDFPKFPSFHYSSLIPVEASYYGATQPPPQTLSHQAPPLVGPLVGPQAEQLVEQPVGLNPEQSVGLDVGLNTEQPQLLYYLPPTEQDLRHSLAVPENTLPGEVPAPFQFTTQRANDPANSAQYYLDFSPINTPKPKVELLSRDNTSILINLFGFLDGRFFIAGGDLNDNSYLSCYRRNFIQVASKLSFSDIPVSIKFSKNNEFEEEITKNIKSLRLSIKSTQNFSKEPVELLYFPIDSSKIKTTNNTNSSHKSSLRPQYFNIPISIISLSKPIEIEWKRLQFKSATANNGRKPAFQQYYTIIIQLEATIENENDEEDETIVVASVTSRPIVVRGRNPSFYTERDDILLTRGNYVTSRDTVVIGADNAQNYDQKNITKITNERSNKRTVSFDDSNSNGIDNLTTNKKQKIIYNTPISIISNFSNSISPDLQNHNNQLMLQQNNNNNNFIATSINNINDFTKNNNEKELKTEYDYSSSNNLRNFNSSDNINNLNNGVNEIDIDNNNNNDHNHNHNHNHNHSVDIDMDIDSQKNDQSILKPLSNTIQIAKNPDLKSSLSLSSTSTPASTNKSIQFSINANINSPPPIPKRKKKSNKKISYEYFPLNKAYYLPPVEVVYFPHGEHHPRPSSMARRRKQSRAESISRSKRGLRLENDDFNDLNNDNDKSPVDFQYGAQYRQFFGNGRGQKYNYFLSK